jgi:hypothetical protein
MKGYYLMFYRLLFLSLLIFLLSACGGKRPQPTTPPTPSEPTIQADISSEQHRIISARLDEIRLAEGIASRVIPLDTVWMIPLNTNQDITAKMQYLEDGHNITIRAGEPYTPTSPWFISIERDDLEGENFGIWFVIVNVGDNSLISWDEFHSVMIDVGIVLVSGVASTALTTITPGVPDEALTISVGVTRGRSLLATLAVLGRRFTNEIPTMGATLTERSIDNVLESTSASLDKLSYFSEVYVIIPAANDYYLNNQISAVTADGSLEVVFSIFDTDNLSDAEAAAFQATEKRTDIFPPVECNPQHPSELQAGIRARVVQPNRNAYPNIFSQDIAFRLQMNDEVTLIFPYCDINEQVLWWRVRNSAGEYGFTAESSRSQVFLEAVGNE